MYQQPPQQPWQPQDPQPKQGTFSQPQWQQQPSYYSQPTAGFGQPPGPPPRPPRKRNRLWLILGIVGGILIISCVMCGVISALAGGSHPTAASTPTAALTQQAAILAATSTPTDTPTLAATQPPTATPTMKP